MNRRLSSILQLVFLIVLAWTGFRLLARLHVLLVVAVMLLAVVNLVAAWIVRHEPKLFAVLYAKPALQPYLKLVCWCMGEQPGGRDPHQPPTSEAELLLKTAEDFRVAAFRAQQIVRGHDAVIDRMLTRIQETLLLRSKRNGGSEQPLSSFLLVGSSSIGKCYLARVISKLLYRSPGTLVFDCGRITLERLTGTGSSPGELLESVRKQPFQLIVIEHTDRAAPDVLELLSTILTKGSVIAPDTRKPVSFVHTTIVMTAEQGWSLLQPVSEQELPEGTWHRRAVEVLSAETSLSPESLNAISDILLCQPPDDMVQAEVVALLTKKEAAAHGVSLSRIEPEILMSQIVQITDDTGFSLVPERVQKLLRKPLLAAMQAEQKSLSLRVRWAEPISAGGTS